MNHLDILLPFGLPQAEMAPDLLRACQTPALAMLLARGKPSQPLQHFGPFARALPHEHWLSRQFGLTGANSADERGNSPPAAVPLLQTHHPSRCEGHWFVLQPAHLHVARSHLMLTDTGQLALEETNARRLFQSALAPCEESGHTLLYIDAATWLLRADGWAGLLTASPQAASGRNIDIWMPAGPGARAWRKLQNEVQMQWFSESLNEERERHGRKPVNSLWLWGGGDAGALSSTIAYQAAFNLHGWSRAFNAAQQSDATLETILAAPGERGLLMLDTLLEPGLAQEWEVWLQGMETLERDWFAPLRQALQDKRLNSLSLILSGQDKLLHLTASAASLRKFWVPASLAKLAV
ncbi:MAG TPA: hypothetical protein VFA14_03455 [Herbaspirillum sp.]|nr:hypothetical protein [Herbaspirillum sp.]